MNKSLLSITALSLLAVTTMYGVKKVSRKGSAQITVRQITSEGVKKRCKQFANVKRLRQFVMGNVPVCLSKARVSLTLEDWPEAPATNVVQKVFASKKYDDYTLNEIKVALVLSHLNP